MGKVENKTKQEVRDAIFHSDQWYTFDNTPMWRRAFELFNETVPDDEKLPISGCGKCYQKVREWLDQ